VDSGLHTPLIKSTFILGLKKEQDKKSRLLGDGKDLDFRLSKNQKGLFGLGLRRVEAQRRILIIIITITITTDTDGSP
jgi:hypothetical protein